METSAFLCSIHSIRLVFVIISFFNVCSQLPVFDLVHIIIGLTNHISQCFLAICIAIDTSEASMWCTGCTSPVCRNGARMALSTLMYVGDDNAVAAIQHIPQPGCQIAFRHILYQRPVFRKCTVNAFYSHIISSGDIAQYECHIPTMQGHQGPLHKPFIHCSGTFSFNAMAVCCCSDSSILIPQGPILFVSLSSEASV